MPAYNYYPATYQPYQSFFQPTYPQIQQPVQQTQTQTQTSLIWVGGEQEAQNYPVAPNNAVAMWDSSAPVVYVKQADASGRPTIKTFDLVERSQNAPTASSAKSSTDIEFATKRDLEALAASLHKMEEKVESMGKRRVRRDDDDE